MTVTISPSTKSAVISNSAVLQETVQINHFTPRSGWQWVGKWIYDRNCSSSSDEDIPESDHDVSVKKYALKVLNKKNEQISTLETVEFTPTNSPKEIKHKEFIIEFCPNRFTYNESVLREDAKELQCTMIGFNYRGSGKSRGIVRSQDDLIIDGIAQVERLLKLGAQPENITLRGNSLGGAIATFGASHYHKLNKKMYLFNDRSFSSIRDMVPGIVGQLIEVDTRQGMRAAVLAWTTKWALRFFAFIGVASLANWNLNAASASKNIPDNYKAHVVLRSKGKKNKHDNEDPIISYESASYHKALVRSKGKQSKTAIKAVPSEAYKKEDAGWKEGIHNADIRNLVSSSLQQSNLSLFASRYIQWRKEKKENLQRNTKIR